METALIIFRQTVVMFLYMFAGYLLFRYEKITVRGTRDIGSLLLWLVIPTVIVNSFCTAFSQQRLMQLLMSSLLGAVSLAIAMLIAGIIFRRDPVDNFGSAFSNAGFIGIPLVQAALGDEAVFYLVGIIAMLNLLQWTYGVRIMTGEKSALSLKNIAVNPILAGVIIGLILFLTGIGGRLPEVVSVTLKGISAVNAPLAMIVLGSYLAQSDIRKMLLSVHLYWVSAVRLLIIPTVTLLVFSIIPAAADIKLAVFIAAAAPIGANVAVYAQLHGKDYPYACQTVALTTLLSIITLPLMLVVAAIML